MPADAEPAEFRFVHRHGERLGEPGHQVGVVAQVLDRPERVAVRVRCRRRCMTSGVAGGSSGSVACAHRENPSVARLDALDLRLGGDAGGPALGDRPCQVHTADAGVADPDVGRGRCPPGAEIIDNSPSTSPAWTAMRMALNATARTAGRNRWRSNQMVVRA